MQKLTHLNLAGRGRMVDISCKEVTRRVAVGQAKICMKQSTIALIKEGKMGKGDVLGVAQTAGIMAAKQTAQVIPMCHHLLLTGVDLDFTFFEDQSSIKIKSTVSTVGKTGAEMEALMSVSAAALTIYDMCKAVDKDMVISEIYLLKKTGGRSGAYQRQAEEKNF